MAMEVGEEEDAGMAVMNRYRNSSAPEHKQLVAVVSAVTEVLKEQHLPLNPTAYFAAIMSPLQQQCSTGSVSGPDTTAFCTFLSMVLPKVSTSVLRARSEKTLEVLTQLLSHEKAPASTVKYGLTCLEYVLRAADKSNWPAIAASFNLLLKYTLDVRPKVRKRAQLCTGEVLKAFQGSPALDKASEMTASCYESIISPFAGVYSANRSKNKDTSAAAQVLYMLGGLKHILPCMPSKGVTKVLPGMVLLLKLRQSLVTRQVLNVLFALNRASRRDIPASELSTVIGAVSSIISGDNSDVDEVMTVLHVLQHSLSNLHAIDPGLCATRLPVCFDAITELFALEQEELVYGAAECLRSLIDYCIDDAMVKQGLLQAQLNASRREPKSTPIEQICSSAVKSLSYQYSAAWDKALYVVSALFTKLGEASFSLMAGAVRALAELQSLEDEDMPYKKQLSDALGAAVVAMGPDKLLELLPLEMDGTDLSGARVWILPILKQHIVGAKLRYFAENIAPLAGRLTSRAQKYVAEGRPIAAKNAEACAESLWALLPSFCNYPVDTKESFQIIARLLGDTMKNNVNLRGIISSSIQILIKQNKTARDADEGMDVDNQNRFCSKDVASANLSAIAAFSDKFLPHFFNLFCESSPEKRGDLQAVIGAIASISSKATVQKFFKTVIDKLLQATKDADAKDRRCMFMDLALSLVEGLDHKGLNALFAVAKPALQDPDSGVQKKGYKVLAGICKEHPDYVSDKAQDIFQLVQEATSSCQSSAKQYRILCLQSLILHLVQQGEESASEYVTYLLKEAILALKEINKKTRDAAYDFLIGIGHGLLNSSQDKLIQFFRMVVGCSAVTGSAGEPHVISAAISGISRLVYEFPMELEHEVQRYMPSAFYLLSNYKSREVIKSLLGLMKVLVARLSTEDLTSHLKSIVQSMMVWSDDTKNRFKAKVRTILERLIRKCGYDAVAAVMPKEHAKHLVNIRKRREQAEKKKRSIIDGGEDEQRSHISRATTRSRWRHTDVFSDTDEENDGDDESEGGNVKSTFAKSKSTVRSKKLPKSKRRLPEDMSEDGRSEPLDLLDVTKTRASMSALKSKKVKPESDDEDMEFDPEGRLIVQERRHAKRPREDEDEDEKVSKVSKVSKATKRTADTTSRSNKKSKKAAKGSWAYKGDEYVNKKGAGGDIKKEGKLEPYAYWPLDAKLLNRRGEKVAAARKGMQSVFKVTKKLEGLSVNKALGGIQKRKKQNKAHKGAKKGKR